MEEVRSRVIRGPKDRQGKTRKFIPVPGVFYEDFEFGQIVTIKTPKEDETEQES